MSVTAYAENVRLEHAAGSLPARARPFLFATIGLAAAATAAASTAHGGNPRWADFAVVLVVGAVTQIFATHSASNQVFHTGLVFSVAAALLLPPELVVVVCVGQHLPEWLRQRYPWYIQSFNIANVVLSGLAAWSVRDGFASAGIRVSGVSNTSSVLVAVAAALAFVLVNHLLLARMLKLARGHEPGATGLFSLDGLATDLVLAGIGIAIAFALLGEPALTPIVVLPLVLIHRALVVPSLRDQALRDHKTGLLNSRGMEEAAHDELVRARRFGRPLSVLLCDVDDLRGINNRHGHLEGDAALARLAGAFRAELRSYDLCARFGGDEFVVVLPETSKDDALQVAGRIQEWLRGHPLPTGGGPLEVGVSIGAASCEEDDGRLGDLLARADASMYEAKRSGRQSFVTVA